MQIEAINHVQLAMPAGGEDSARRFYVDILGMAEVTKPPHLARRGGCWFERGSVKVHLGIDAEFTPAKKAHPAFTVSGLAELILRFEAAGFEVVEDKALNGYDRRYVYDPFGNRMEFMEPV